jgi:hypothetical protein
LRGYTVGSKVGVGTAHQRETVRIRKKEGRGVHWEWHLTTINESWGEEGPDAGGGASMIIFYVGSGHNYYLILIKRLKLCTLCKILTYVKGQ